MPRDEHKAQRSGDSHRQQLETDQLEKDRDSLEGENRTLCRKLEAPCETVQTGNEGNHRSDQTLQLAELIIENSPAILFRRLASDRPELRKMVYVSPNISRFGYRAEDFLSGRIMFRDIVYPEDSKRTLLEIQSFVSKNIETYSQTYRIVTRQGDVRWVEDRTSVVEDSITGLRYHQGLVIDIHRRKEAEDKLRKSEEKYRRIVETAGEGFLLMEKDLTIVDCNSAYSRLVARSRSELIGQKPFETGNDDYRQFWSSSQEELSPSQYREFDGEITSSDKRRIPVLVHANTLRSDAGEIIGNMAFVTDMTEQKKALSLAGEVQRSLLPSQAPRIQGLDIAGRNVPCDEVGGDYFDYLWNEDAKDGPFSVVVGDISGHGVDSALLMTSARALLRMRASHPGAITDIVTNMNHHLTQDVLASGRFMTLFYLTFDKERKSIGWVRAGHDPAWLYDPDLDQFEELKGPGMALGVDQEYAYQLQEKGGLKANQVIVVATDGIWEGCNKSGEMFGKERFKNLISKNAASNAETILTKVLEEHSHFCRGRKTEDDITLVVIKITQ